MSDDLGPEVRKKLLPAKSGWALKDSRLGKQSRTHSEHESGHASFESFSGLHEHLSHCHVFRPGEVAACFSWVMVSEPVLS